MAAPAVQGTATTTAAANNANIVINKPSGLADGEVLVAIVATGATSTGFSGPVGWTEHVDHSAVGSYGMAIYTKIITNAAGEAATYSFAQANGAQNQCGGMFRISGADNTTPVRVVGTVTDQTNNTITTIPASAITGAVDDLLLYCAMVEGSLSWTPPTGMTEVLDIASGGSGASTSKSACTIASLVLASAGTTGDKTGTASGVGTGLGVLIAIQPTLVTKPPYLNFMVQPLAH